MRRLEIILLDFSEHLSSGHGTVLASTEERLTTLSSRGSEITVSINGLSRTLLTEHY